VEAFYVKPKRRQIDPGGLRPFPSLSLASPPKILITRLSVGPGRELNGRL